MRMRAMLIIAVVICVAPVAHAGADAWAGRGLFAEFGNDEGAPPGWADGFASGPWAEIAVKQVAQTPDPQPSNVTEARACVTMGNRRVRPWPSARGYSWREYGCGPVQTTTGADGTRIAGRVPTSTCYSISGTSFFLIVRTPTCIRSAVTIDLAFRPTDLPIPGSYVQASSRAFRLCRGLSGDTGSRIRTRHLGEDVREGSAVLERIRGGNGE